MGVFLVVVVVVVVVVIVVVIVVVVVVVVFAVVAIFLVFLGGQFSSFFVGPWNGAGVGGPSPRGLRGASLHSASRVGAPMSVLAGCLIGCLAGCCCPRSPLLLQSTSLFDLSPWPPLYCWLELLSLLASVFNQ